MRSWARVGAVGLAAAVACRFDPSNATTGADGAIDAPGSTVDAGICTGSSVECADGDTLRTCVAAGSNAVDMPCAWGCSTANGAHCATLLPSGGAAVGSDLDGSGLVDVVLMNATIDTVGGGIDPGVRPGGMPDMIKNGIDWSQRVNGISVFRFGNLTIDGTLEFKAPGDNSMPYPGVVLVASGSITVNGAIDAEGQCNGQSGGPGGFVGGINGANAAGSGGGSGGQNDSTRGGGGGGYGSNGGAGGMGGSNPAAAGGVYFGDDVVTLLIGGGGGGAGGNGGVPHGGGGGGAIQLVANGTITISPTGSINAGGCNGKSGTQNQDSGGGGGAGGTILLEAHDITINGQLAVNGAGGGAGSTNTNGDQGTSGTLGRTPAPGSTNGAAAGGNGGAANLLGGSPGAGAGNYGGGGGGSVGRIRINTRAGSASVDNTKLSPALDDVPTTTCTQGSAATQ